MLKSKRKKINKTSMLITFWLNEKLFALNMIKNNIKLIIVNSYFFIESMVYQKQVLWLIQNIFISDYTLSI